MWHLSWTYRNSSFEVIITGDAEKVAKASLSFPSQYASHICYGSVFNVLAIYCIPQLKRVPMLHHLLLLGMGSLGVLGSVSRYVDNYNHWYDVLCGMALGTGFGIYFAVVPLRLVISSAWLIACYD